MLLNDYLKLNYNQNRQINVSTGQIGAEKPASAKKQNPNKNGENFKEILGAEIAKKSSVEFSGHALRRIESRSIDISEKLERLNQGVEIAASKGSADALVLIDSTAFVVSVKNNKVITTLSGDDLNGLRGSAFTNIDATIII